MSREALFIRDVFPSGKSIVGTSLSENEDYYQIVKANKKRGLKQVSLSSNVLLNILRYYFAEKHARLISIKLLTSVQDNGKLTNCAFEELINQACAKTNQNRDSVVYVLEYLAQALTKGYEIKEITLADQQSTFSLNLAGIVETSASNAKFGELTKIVEKCWKNALS